MTKKFWNGKEISEKNLVDIIAECTKNNWKNSDLFKETEIACEIIAYEDYEGKEEDIECIIEKLKDDGATLFDLENSIANGDWYFMQTETWKKYMREGECEMKKMKKFELTQNKKNWNGVTLYQIKACNTFVTNSGVEVSEGELGGWVEKEENLSQRGKAWIWKDAKVYGTAKICGNAEIWGEAQICGNARVFGNAKIYGNAKVYNNAIVWGNAQIYGNAEISDNAKIYDDAKVLGDVKIYDNVKILGYSTVSGNAKVFDNAYISGNSKISGNSIIYGDAEVWGDAEISGDSKITGDTKIGGDAFISSPNHILTITPVGKYRVSLTFFKTKNDSIKISYNWDIYTLEKFQSVMNDWTEEEIEVAKAVIEAAKLQLNL